MKTISNNWSDDRDIKADKPLVMKIANSRGKKPVMRDIKKAYDIISNLMQELNPCEAKDALKECDRTLWKLMHDND